MKRNYYEDDISDENKQAINLIELSCAENKELPPIIEESEKNILKSLIKIKIRLKN